MLKVIEGDLLDIEEGILAHQCNCQGVMGSGIALAIKNKWPKVYELYRDQYDTYVSWAKFGETPEAQLGRLQVVAVGDQLAVANVYGQSLYGASSRKTNYGAVAKAIHLLADYRSQQIYVPYLMGCGLGGGDWEVYSEIIEFFIPEAIVVRLPEVKTLNGGVQLQFKEK